MTSYLQALLEFSVFWWGVWKAFLFFAMFIRRVFCISEFRTREWSDAVLNFTSPVKTLPADNHFCLSAWCTLRHPSLVHLKKTIENSYCFLLHISFPIKNKKYSCKEVKINLSSMESSYIKIFLCWVYCDYSTNCFSF